MKSYLLSQSQKYTERVNVLMERNKHKLIELASPVSIYVPETASSSPISSKAYKKAVKPFIEITNDKKWSII